MKYDLELDHVVAEIQKVKAKTVLIQLGDGLKPEATKVADYIQQKTGVLVLIWSDSCYGVCDVPDVKGIDLVVQFGHNALMPTF